MYFKVLYIIYSALNFPLKLGEHGSVMENSYLHHHYHSFPCTLKMNRSCSCLLCLHSTWTHVMCRKSIHPNRVHATPWLSRSSGTLSFTTKPGMNYKNSSKDSSNQRGPKDRSTVLHVFAWRCVNLLHFFEKFRWKFFISKSVFVVESLWNYKTSLENISGEV